MWLNPGDARQCKIGMPCSWAMLEPVNDIYGPSPFFGDNKYFTSFPHLEYGIFCEVVYGNIWLRHCLDYHKILHEARITINPAPSLT